MAITKTNKQIKIKSGNNFQLNLLTTWETLGNTVEGEFNIEDSTTGGTWSSGDEWEIWSTTKATLNVVLGQVSKEIWDKINSFVGKFVKIYIDNGIDQNNEYNELYFPEVQVLRAHKLKMSGKDHQLLVLKLLPQPQSAFPSVVPDTGLPADAHASGAVAVEGTDPYCVMLNSAAA